MPELDLATQTGPILVTLAYVLVYYGFMVVVVLRTKNRLVREYRERGEKFDRYFGNDREMLAADRIQLNIVEHMGPFLILLWLNALFVSPTGATIAGGAYVVSRLVYPFMMGNRLGRSIRASILVSTAPSYLAIAYLAGALIFAVVTQ